MPIFLKKISNVIRFMILSVFFIFTLYLSVIFTITAYNKPTAILRIPFTYVDVAVVFCFASIIIRSIQKWKINK